MKGTLGYKVRTITCTACGQSVTGHLRPNQRFCSLACYRTGPRPQRKTGAEKPCGWCKAPVYVKRGAKARHHFCCREHFDAWAARRKTVHVCKVCGGEFRWSPSRQRAYNITYCSLGCRDADPDRRAMLVEMNATQQRGGPNRLERTGYALLDSLGVAYLRQHVIGGKFCVDAFVPDASLVIQFDGDYWHGNPIAFPEPSARQRKRIHLDRSQDAYMAKCGYRVIRIWESELKADREHVRGRLQRFLTHGSHRPVAPA